MEHRSNTSGSSTPNLQLDKASIRSSLPRLKWSVAFEPALSLLVGSTAKAVVTDNAKPTRLGLRQERFDALPQFVADKWLGHGRSSKQVIRPWHEPANAVPFASFF